MQKKGYFGGEDSCKYREGEILGSQPLVTILMGYNSTNSDSFYIVTPADYNLIIILLLIIACKSDFLFKYKNWLFLK